MARKGALFIVADGMGGHAAGEVASEIAVDAVTNVYYQDDSDDAATSLLHAIKRANALIHQRAAENMLRSGMGTTCVAAVLRGSTAYIANVGDSRAYIVRGGTVRQISQDHSWVAEQVRAGLLTEEQARTHAQRNVITRCLGTQSDVDIDVFPEPLEENDALLLCSDGLSGLVSDDEIQRIVEQAVPQESVYHLIERANENGGPDNITAIVIRVQEVGWEPPGQRRPAFVGGREVGEDTAVLGMLPGGAAASTMVGDRNGAAGYPLRLSSGPLTSPDSITAPQPALQRRGSRNRLFYPTLALVVLLIVAAVGTGAYYLFHGSNGVSVDQSLQNTQTLITKASREVATNPTQALHDLSTAQSTLHGLQSQGSSLTSTQHQKLTSLQTSLTGVVQSAITSYNQQSSITTVLCSTTPPVLNTGSTGVQQVQVTSVQTSPSGTSQLYALGIDGRGGKKVYQVSNTSLTPVSNLPLPTNAPQVIGIAGNGTQLIMLSSSTSSGTGTNTSTKSPSYYLSAYTPGLRPAGQNVSIPSVVVTAQTGQTPTQVVASGQDVFVIFTSSSSTTFSIQNYTIARGKFSTKPVSESLSASNAVVSVAAFPNKQLFILLADGSINSLQFTGSGDSLSGVSIAHAIPSPLPTGGSVTPAFTVLTPVPTIPAIAQHGKQPLSIGASTISTLVAVKSGNTQHLYVMDAEAHRILDFTENASPTAGATPGSSGGSPGTGGGAIGTATPAVSPVVGFTLVGQYVSPALFSQLKSMAAAPDDSAWYIVGQGSSSSTLNLITIQAGSQVTCK